MRHLVVVVIIIVCVELVIKWNYVTEAYLITTSAQHFLILLSICLTIRVLWHRVKQSQGEEDIDTWPTCSSADDDQRRRGNVWPTPGPVPREWLIDIA